MQARLATGAFAIRLGDANTTNENIGTNQAGQRIDLDTLRGRISQSFKEITKEDQCYIPSSEFNLTKEEIVSKEDYNIGFISISPFEIRDEYEIEMYVN